MQSNGIYRVVLGVVALGLATFARGYVLDTDESGVYVDKWYSSPIAMQVKLPTGATPSGSGQRASVITAMAQWNARLGTVRFSGQGMAPGPYATGNSVNEIVMASTVDGEVFPAGTLAVAMSYRRGNERTESDIVFNSAYTWSDYRGPLRSNQPDIQRVAIHELGHVLGLHHPDEHGQSVVAIMNSRISDVDSLQWDDVQGGQALYGAPGLVPANDHFADAAEITLADGMIQVSGRNIAATREVAEPLHAESTGSHSVWWRWFAPENGETIIDTFGSNFDTTLAIYTGTELLALSVVGSNDDEETPEQNPTPTRKRTSKVAFSAKAKTTYYIAVDGWADEDEDHGGYHGSITLNLNYAAMPPPTFIGLNPAEIDAHQWLSFQVVATHNPTSYGATGLPAGVSIDAATGLISGRPTVPGVYEVAVSATNTAGTTVRPWTLTVQPTAPSFTHRPAKAAVVEPGAALVIEFDTSSTAGPVSYRWKRNGRILPGETARTLSIPRASTEENGYYTIEATNEVGTSTEVAFVRVLPAQTQLVAWGELTGEMRAELPQVSGAVDVAFYQNGAVVVKRDGTLAVLGSAGGLGSLANETEVVAVSVGVGGTMVLKSDGSVVGNGRQENLPAEVRGAKVVAIAHVRSQAAALRADGRLVIWRGSEMTVIADVIAISVGNDQGLALKSDGTLAGWHFFGHPVQPPGSLTGIVAARQGAGHAMALRGDGTLETWGEMEDVPAAVGHPIGIAAGLYHSLAVVPEGAVVAWGLNYAGQVSVPEGLNNVFAVNASGDTSVAFRDASGDAAPEIVQQPLDRVVAEGETVELSVRLAAEGGYISYQWLRDGTALMEETSTLRLDNVQLSDAGSYTVVAKNRIGEVRSVAAVLSVRPVPVVTSVGARRQVVEVGQSFSVSVTATGEGPLSYQWLRNNRPIVGATNSTYHVGSASLEDRGSYVVRITDANGTRHQPMFVFVVPRTFRVLARGASAAGLNDRFMEINDAVDIVANADGAVAIKRNGELEWLSASPWYASGLTDVAAVAHNHGIVAALIADGSVVIRRNAEVDRLPVSDVVALSSSGAHILALRANGTVFAWGENRYGQADVPADLKDVVAVGAGHECSIALCADGRLVGWGRHSPPALEQIVAIATGREHYLALREDGTVIAWGSEGANYAGQLNVPDGLADVRAIVAGLSHSVALKADGTVVEWGEVASAGGQVSRVWSIAAGAHFTLVLTEPDPATKVEGVYLGSFKNSEGRWALRVNADGTGMYMAVWREEQRGMVIPVEVSPDGHFFGTGSSFASVSASSGVQSLSDSQAGARPTASVESVSGTVGGGEVTGTVVGSSAAFSGAKDEGWEINPAYYALSATHQNGGELHAIIGPSSQGLMLAVVGRDVAGGGIVVNDSGEFVANSPTHLLGMAFDHTNNEVTARAIAMRGGVSEMTYAGLIDPSKNTTRLVAISTRSRAGTNDQTLIMGFVVAGSGEKELVVRGVGPTLSVLGVAEALSDPEVLLYRGDGSVLERNDNWSGGAAMLQTFARLGMSPALAPDSKDAALIRTISAGLYTAHVTASTGESGIALVEVYDGDTAPTSRFSALSTRTVAGRGENTLIAGIVLAGDDPKRLLIRGVGPSLVSQGVSRESVLRDPQLALFRGSEVIARNDDWGGTTELMNAFASVGLATFESAVSKDAAMVVMLEPGVYTVHVSGADDTSGVALIEVYEMP